MQSQEPSQESIARAIIDALPQRAYLDDVTINNWISMVQAVEPERLVWHARRLSGIGGSEIGSLLAYDRGYFTFEDATPDKIIGGKLMIVSPTSPNGDCQRGIFLEDEVSDRVHHKYRCRRAEDLLQAIREADPDPAHPWQVGNPDDLVWFGDKLFLVDYKVPRATNIDKVKKAGAPLDYAAQLHHYKQIADRVIKHPITGLLLAPFDTNAWEPHLIPIKENERLHQDLLRVGDKYWNDYVMQGQVPDCGVLAEEGKKPKPSRINIDTLSPEVVNQLHELATVKAITDVSKEAYESKGRLLKEYFDKRIPDRYARIDHAGLTISAKTGDVIEKASAIEFLEREGVDLGALIKEGLDRYDDDKLKQTIDSIREEKGDDAVKPCFIPERKITVSVSRARKGHQADTREQYRNSARVLVDQGPLPQSPAMVQEQLPSAHPPPQAEPETHIETPAAQNSIVAESAAAITESPLQQKTQDNDRISGGGLTDPNQSVLPMENKIDNPSEANRKQNVEVSEEKVPESTSLGLTDPNVSLQNNSNASKSTLVEGEHDERIRPAKRTDSAPAI